MPVDHAALRSGRLFHSSGQKSRIPLMSAIGLVDHRVDHLID
jgi:hypothetical protein